MRKITPEKLTAEAFASFGDVVEMRDSVKHFPINHGQTERYHDLAKVDIFGEGGRPAISLFQSKPLPRPLVVKLMERHPLGSQAFYPLSGRPYMVVVAEKGELKPENIRIFLASPTQGVNYHAGTWHHFSLALEDVSDFLVVDRTGEGHNCDEVELAEADQIEIDY